MATVTDAQKAEFYRGFVDALHPKGNAFEPYLGDDSRIYCVGIES